MGKTKRRNSGQASSPLFNLSNLDNYIIKGRKEITMKNNNLVEKRNKHIIDKKKEKKPNISELENQIDNLKEKYELLQEDYAYIYHEYKSALKEIEGLVDENYDLSKELNQKEYELDYLIRYYNNLKDTISNINKTYNRIKQ